jgi:hypothetical protein
MFENKLLRRIFGPKGKEVRRGWRKFSNEHLHNILLIKYYRDIKIRENEMDGRFDKKIKIDIKETGNDGVD